MRLWTLHPKYLDAKGLVALWREALLAQKVLQGRTKGYRHHPQLARFKAQDKPVAALAAYLKGVRVEAKRRGYEFDGSKIAPAKLAVRISETDGQLLYEWKHLQRKLKQRAPHMLANQRDVSIPESHPIFRVVRGAIREWEIAAKPSSSKKRQASKAFARPRRISPRHKFAKSVRSRSRAA
jgi:hypothetical protein